MSLLEECGLRDLGPVGSMEDEARLRVSEIDHPHDHLFNSDFRQIITVVHPEDYVQIRLRYFPRVNHVFST